MDFTSRQLRGFHLGLVGVSEEHATITSTVVIASAAWPKYGRLGIHGSGAYPVT
jgi:hypothetical protein